MFCICGFPCGKWTVPSHALEFNQICLLYHMDINFNSTMNIPTQLRMMFVGIINSWQCIYNENRHENAVMPAPHPTAGIRFVLSKLLSADSMKYKCFLYTKAMAWCKRETSNNIGTHKTRNNKKRPLKSKIYTHSNECQLYLHMMSSQSSSFTMANNYSTRKWNQSQLLDSVMAASCSETLYAFVCTSLSLLH